MFEIESRFSREWIFQECNLHNHCLRVKLKVPVVINGIKTKDVYVLEVVATEVEQVEIMQNIAAGINTNSASIAVRAFINNMPPTDAVDIGLSTANIESVDKIQ